MGTVRKAPPAGSTASPLTWAICALMLLGAAVATGRFTYLYWLPCRGSMSNGLFYIWHGDFNDACLRRMDLGTTFPYLGSGEQTAGAALLGLVATGLMSVAWFVLVMGMRWQLRTKAAATAPALVGLGLYASTAWTAHRTVPGGQDDYPSLWWLLALEITAVGVIVAVRRWQPETSGWPLLRLPLVLSGVTAFGFLHQAFDFVTMLSISDAGWDAPPGTGYVTVVVIAVAAAAAAHQALVSVRPAQRPCCSITA